MMYDRHAYPTELTLRIPLLVTVRDARHWGDSYLPDLLAMPAWKAISPCRANSHTVTEGDWAAQAEFERDYTRGSRLSEQPLKE
jgi:hypothetical protein